MELQSTVEHIDDDRVLFHIEIAKDDAKTLIEQFTIALAYQENLKPEEGGTLEEAAIAHMGEEAFHTYIKQNIMSYSFSFAAEAAQILTVGKPRFTTESAGVEGEPFSYDALCVLKPSIELSSYDPVHIVVPTLDVSEEDVERYLVGLAQSHAYLEEDTEKYAIALGDQVELEIETFKDGVRCDQLCSEGRTYTTGAQQMPEEFDQAILDMHVGETREIEYSCPGFTLDENYQPETEHYTSTVTAKKVQRTVVPEITDEWVSETTNGTLSSVEELREQAKQTILERKTVEYRHYKNLKSAEELARRFEGEISDAVYEAVVQDVLVSFEAQLEQQQTTKEEFLRQQGVTEQQIMAHFTNQVRDQLVKQLALDAVADHFKLEVTDEDLDEYFRAAAAPGLEAMMRLDFERNGRLPEARLSALRLKANDYVTEQAEITLQD